MSNPDLSQHTFISLSNIPKIREGFEQLKARIEGVALTSSILPTIINALPEGIVTYWIQKGTEHIDEQERPILASFNIINKCNLYCAGCYWGKTERKEEHKEELSQEEGIMLIDELWQKGVRQFMFLGGEPFMTETSRANVKAWVKHVAKLKGFSTIVTNGTYGIPDIGELPRTHYFISFDGGEKGMLKVRGRDQAHNNEPVFNRVSKMLQERAARSGGYQGDVMLAMTISANNVDTLDEFMENAKKWGVAGTVFSFATPSIHDKRADGSYPHFYLTGDRRNTAVQKVLEIKDNYGDFVAMSRRAIELFDLQEVARWSKVCPTTWATSIASNGLPIERCIFGPEADCDNCGCNLATSIVALREGDKETLTTLGEPQRRAINAVRQMHSNRNK